MNNTQQDVHELEKLVDLLENALSGDSELTLPGVYSQMLMQSYEDSPKMVSLYGSNDNTEPIITLTVRGLIELLIEAAVQPGFTHGFSTPVFTGRPFSDVVSAYTGPELQSTTYNPDTDEIIWINNPDEYSGEYDIMPTFCF